MFRSILLSVVLLAMFGCKSGVENVDVINVDDSQILVCDYGDVDQTLDVKFSTLMDSIRIVRFENNEEAYFKCQWMHFSDNYIVIRQHDNRPILLFNKDGKFITELGSYGSGPVEYDTSIKDCIIDERNGVIYLLPFVGPKILKYDFSGRYVGKIELPSWINKGKMYLRSDSILSVFHIALKDRDEVKFNGANINLNNDSIQYVYVDQLATKLVSNGAKQGLENEVWSYRSAPDFPISLTYSDTLYHFNQENNQIKARFTFKIDLEAEKNEFSCFILNEIPDYYVVYMIGNAKDVIVDKKAHKAFKANFVNDYMGNRQSTLKVQDGYFWANYEPIEFIELINSIINDGCTPAQKAYFESLLSEIDEDDNDILLLGKLK